MDMQLVGGMPGMRNFSGYCRFAYNALLFEGKEQYQDYLDQPKLRQSFGEALSKDEAKALSVKPALNQDSFNLALRR